jgi:hypothetical protein
MGRWRQKWFLNDKRHRVDGPAMEWADGTKEWFLNDIEYEEDEHPFKIIVGEVPNDYNYFLYYKIMLLRDVLLTYEEFLMGL